MRVIIITKQDGAQQAFSSLKKLYSEHPALNVRSLGEYLRKGLPFLRDGLKVERLDVK